MKKEVVPRIYNSESVRIKIKNVFMMLDSQTGVLEGTGELVAAGKVELPEGMEPEVCCRVCDRRGRILYTCESTHHGSFSRAGRHGFTVFQITVPRYGQLCREYYGVRVELFLIINEKPASLRNCPFCRGSGYIGTDLPA